MKFGVVVPWHNPKQRNEFLEAWGLPTLSSKSYPSWLFLQQDKQKEGGAVTKNKGIRRALDAGVDYVIVLDDDCYPAPDRSGLPPKDYTLTKFAEAHIEALQPQKVRMVYPTTNPPPRGMPYKNHFVEMPVAATMGFWLKNPDFDAMTTLVIGANADTTYAQTMIYRHYFPFCGMNFAFHRTWADCAVLVEGCGRYDDIWMGWIWEKVAYERGYCFNLQAPFVNHVRQSNVWKNLVEETKYLEVNEDLWLAVHNAPEGLEASQIRARLFGFLPGQASPAQDPALA